MMLIARVNAPVTAEYIKKNNILVYTQAQLILLGEILRLVLKRNCV